MKTVYVVTNQRGLFLSKDGLWLDRLERNHLYRTPVRDEALNTLIETNAKDIEQRLSLLEVSIDAKGHPQLNA